jgi:1-phosphofructokinase family hexose kinase
MIVCAAPNPSIDKLFLTDVVRVGEIHRPQRVVARAGGKALNAARAARTLGADVRAVALLAGHAGRWIAEELEREGVPADAVWAPGESRSALSVADGRAMTEFYERGDAPGPEAWERFVAAVEAAARGATWLSISGSVPPGIDPAEGARLVAAGHAAGARVAVDQHAATLAAALATGADLVKVNHAEASELTAEDDPLRAARALADALAAAGAPDPVAIVTLGEKGALAVTTGAVLRGDLDVRGPYPTGSGDSFLGGLLSAAPPAGAGADPDRWAAAMAVALGAACANAEAEGAGTLDPERARVLAERARGRIERR